MTLSDTRRPALAESYVGLSDATRSTMPAKVAASGIRAHRAGARLPSEYTAAADATPTYMPDSIEAVWHARIADAQDEITELRRTLARELDRREQSVASALNREGVFLLAQVVESGEGVLFDTLVENLAAPHGWIAIGRLMKAGLLDENGRRMYATPSGASVWEALQAELPG